MSTKKIDPRKPNPIQGHFKRARMGRSTPCCDEAGMLDFVFYLRPTLQSVSPSPKRLFYFAHGSSKYFTIPHDRGRKTFPRFIELVITSAVPCEGDSKPRSLNHLLKISASWSELFRVCGTYDARCPIRPRGSLEERASTNCVF